MGDRSAIKAILGIGAIAFALLMAASFGVKKMMRPSSKQQVVIREKYSPFDARRAWNDLEHIVGLGPRPSGSEAAEALRDYLRAELAKAGVELREQHFEAQTSLGVVPMVNLTAVIPGTREDVILIGNHYDTKYLPGIEFVGANDGGATTAWMLEMARALAPKREGHTLWLVWFDGEEAFQTWSETDGLYGSKAYVAHLRETGDFALLRVMINVDMIGDCYLSILRDREAPDWLSDVVWETAAKLRYGDHFSGFSHTMQDDHLPFRDAGVPALELIDFIYGGSPLNHRQNWHTMRDTIDRVCPESLQAVADVIYHSLPALEAALGDSLLEAESAP